MVGRDPRLRRRPSTGTSRAARRHFSGNGRVGTSSHIYGAYTESYYLSDCGLRRLAAGPGQISHDPRLAAMAALAGLRRGSRRLISAAAEARLPMRWPSGGPRHGGRRCPAAINLAERSFAGELQLRRQVTIVCGDALLVSWPESVDIALASDLVEAPRAFGVDRLYARLARHLAPRGILLVHTFPNGMVLPLRLSATSTGCRCRGLLSRALNPDRSTSA